MSFTPARINAALDGAIADVTHAQLHGGDPGSGGTSNVLAESSRASIALSAASGGESTGLATFTITGATPGNITHVSLWDAASGGVFQGSAALSPQESFAGPGELDVTVSATAS